MTTSATILADSVNMAGNRATTFELRYPWMIHPEFLTHRNVGRNASSTRAIPISRIIADILADPAEPVHWGANQPGMQAHNELTGVRRFLARAAWHGAKRAAILGARVAQKAGAHKQIANRMLMPWMHIRVVVTGTDWNNFFHLRDHPDADPIIRELAKRMRKAHGTSIPNRLQDGEWHRPYIDATTVEAVQNQAWEELAALGRDELFNRISTARAARGSYLLHDGKPTTLTKDLQLFKHLMAGDPKHASPAEHQLQADAAESNPDWWGPMTGFIQFRKTIPGEAVHG